MADFTSLTQDAQRHELATLEQTLLTRREIYRRQHGEEPMPLRRDRENGGAIDVGYKGAHVAVRGPMAIIAVLVALLGVGLIYVNRQGFAETNGLLRQAIADHARLASSQDLLACVVSLSPEERTRARQQPSRDTFVVLCPWLRTETTR